MPGDFGGPVLLVCFLLLPLHTRRRVHRAPGIPHGLLGRKFKASLGRNAPRDRDVVSSRHCEPTGRRKAPPDDRLREAIQLWHQDVKSWIASSQVLLAMTGQNYLRCLTSEIGGYG